MHSSATNEPAAVEPPLDPLGFEPAVVRKCIKSNVRVQSHDRLQEVLILTTVCLSVESQLNEDPYGHNIYGGGDEQGDVDSMDSDSDFSDTTSEEEETEDESLESCSTDGADCEGAHSGDPGQACAKMKAFWLKKEPLCENRHGIWTTYIYYAKVLQKADINWETTSEEVAIKAISWKCIRACQNRLSEDFIKEASALQYLHEWHKSEMSGKSMHETHVMIPNCVMSSETHLFIVMPYARGGDLCMKVAEQNFFSEDTARFWFRQIIKGLETLQMAQICHRDLSPENLIVIEDNCLVIDLGMSLRIPYSVAGRHLISAQVPCGKLPHMSPEIYRKIPFDGHAVDIWAAGTILLFMLTGKRFSSPPLVDRVFEQFNLGLSDDAMDLLHKMFRLESANRLTLRQIQNHPFLQDRV